MNYLLVPDKFKGSLSAAEVIEALRQGICQVDAGAKIHSALVSDGGDGFVESIAHYTDSEYVQCEAKDPLGKELESTYLYEPSTKSAFIEMAQTAGLELLDKEDRNPLYTSTYGTGLQIKHALDHGAENIYVGLGGSATNDGGTGIATAMGYQFLDKDQTPLDPVGKNLQAITSVIEPEASRYKSAKLYAINDVNNPLFGPQGAAYVYAAQKGAGEEEIEFLDKGLRHLDAVVQKELTLENAFIPGAGAAGGTAYGLMTFLGAEFIGGTNFIFRIAGIHDLLKNNPIDYIITGEGKIDDQTLSGKLIHGILTISQSYKIPVIAVCGALDTDEDELKKEGLSAVVEVRDPNQTLEYNMAEAAGLIENAISAYFHSLK